MKKSLSVFAIAVGLSALLSVSLASEVWAQEEAQEDEEMLEGVVEVEELVVTGSRAQSRTVTDSPVPIDVIGADEFAKQGGADLADLVRNVVPSYNVNTQPISDAGTVVRPPNMRGLAPDHALVLVNGKRRHRAAVIHWLGNGVADGAQGPDLAPIPAIALDRVEVLRDGASAQYGSDAIAGVLNFRLKDRSDGLSVETKVGSFQDGEGILGDGEVVFYRWQSRLGQRECVGQPQLGIRQRGRDHPLGAAQRCCGPDCRGQYECGQSRSNLGAALHSRRSEVLCQLRCQPRREPRLLWARQLRQQGDGRWVLFPQSPHPQWRV